MPTLSQARLADLLTPFLPSELAAPILPQLSDYLDLLVKWNAKTNLTAVRDPEQMVVRHFGESLFAANLLAPHVQANDAVLDYGSGAGFPGLPLQLLLPHVRVTLAESQSKKSAFLREAVRSLNLKQTSVHAGRVDQLPASTLFRAVTLRAVDNPGVAAIEATTRLVPEGWLVSLQGEPVPVGAVRLPESEGRYVVLTHIEPHQV